MSTTKGSEEINKESAVETKVNDEKKPGILAGATAAVKQTIQSAKDATMGSEEVNKNKESAVETKVETVDYRSSAGHDEEPPKKEKVEVIHRSEDVEKKPGILADATAAVKNTIQSAKDATSVGGTGKKENCDIK